MWIREKNIKYFQWKGYNVDLLYIIKLSKAVLALAPSSKVSFRRWCLREHYLRMNIFLRRCFLNRRWKCLTFNDVSFKDYSKSSFNVHYNHRRRSFYQYWSTFMKWSNFGGKKCHFVFIKKKCHFVVSCGN